MIIRFTKKQLEVMKVLWDSPKPLVASEIAKLNPSLNINTIQACIRSLIKESAIEVADIVYSGTVLSRSYTPRLSKEEYIRGSCQDIMSTSAILATLLKDETNLEEIEKLEKLVKEKKYEIEGK